MMCVRRCWILAVHLRGTMVAGPAILLLAGRPPRPAPLPPSPAPLAMRVGPSDCRVLSTAGLRPPSVCRLLPSILLYSSPHSMSWTPFFQRNDINLLPTI